MKREGFLEKSAKLHSVA